MENAFLEWWNDRQTGDVLHHFGAIPLEVIWQAQKKGWKVVNPILLSENCNQPKRALVLRRVLIRMAMAAPLPQAFQLPWHSFRFCDRVLVALEG